MVEQKEKKEKKGFFGRFLDLLGGKPPSDSEEDEVKNKSIYAPSEKDPFDLQFVKRFSASGGKFLYCAEEAEAYNYLRLIMEESGLEYVFCRDDNFVSILFKAGILVTDQVDKADAFCSGCEYLVSYNGGIMISARQTMNKKLSELPETFITIARTSQITENLRSALTGIRHRYSKELPSQITTIKGPKKVEEIDESDTTSVCNKEIYLLLMEDQV